MDSEHRHELKTNELASILTNFPEFCKDNANVIFGIALIIVALVTWPMFSRMSQQKKIAKQSQVAENIQQLNQSIGKALSEASTAGALDAVLINTKTLLDSTSKSSNTNLTALAYIKAAQAYRTELHLKREILGSEQVDTQIQKAQDAYQTALDKAQTPTIKAMAQLGLGLCAEERGQTQQAKEIYQAIVNDESYAATALPKQAQLRLDGLQENAETFTFAPAPEELENMTTEELEAALETSKAELEETKKQLQEAENKPVTEDTEK